MLLGRWCRWWLGAVVTEHYFISYSGVDGGDFALSLADALTAGPPPILVWVDKRELRPGEDWDEQIVEAIKTSRGLLFVMTTDSVKPNSVCKDEWVRALKYKKPVIPLRFDRDAELPFRLGSRQYLDFTGSVETGLARLRRHLSWMDTPAGALQALKERLADAERELPRAEEPERTRIEQEIKELRQQIAAQEHVLANPQAASQDTQQRIASGLERERQPKRPVTVRRVKFINSPPMTAPTWFQNRHVETGLIGDFLRDDALRLMTVVGRGGVGKTAMVCRLLKALEGGQLPDDGGPLAVDGIVYLSKSGGHPVSYPNLFADLGRLLPHDTARRLDQLYRDPQQTPEKLLLAVLEGFPTGRTVVLLDNFEDAVDHETRAIKSPELEEALRTVLTAPEHGVKVICTTRVAPLQLLLVQPALQQRLNLDEGLESPFAENILRAMDADGTLGLKTAPDPLLTTARERTRGYPRALEALVAILAADRNTTLPELLAEADKLLPENVVEVLVGEAFNRLDPMAQQVMQALAIYGLPVPAVAVDFLLQPYRAEINSAPVLSRLVNMQFVRRDAGRYYLHQVDRDYALSRIPEGQPDDREATEPQFSRYGLWHRGAEYFEQTRKPRQAWKHLDDLAPQLAEFELRYRDDDYDTATWLLLEIDFYLFSWGHYRLAVELHEQLQDKLTNPYLKQTSLGRLAICYQKLGETRRAIDLEEQALAIAREIGHRASEAVLLANLGYCHADLGEIRRAIDFHERALAIAREIGHRTSEAVHLGNLGACHARLGETQRAIHLYEQALAIAGDINDRLRLSLMSAYLGDSYVDCEAWEQAIQRYDQAIPIADEIGFVHAQSRARDGLAKARLFLGELSAARQTAEAARSYDYPQSNASASATLGVILLRQGQTEPARLAFTEAVTQADSLLERTSDNYRALDTKALALCGLALLGDAARLPEAHAAAQAARAVNRDAGVVQRVVRLLDALAVADQDDILAPIRAIATGKND
jgi:tetratricopeptide (TPR) repeat protein